jgi:hypothetical protein
MAWRRHPELSYLLVSDDGGGARVGAELLELWVSAAGYVQVNVDAGPPRSLHRLVLETWLGPPPAGWQAHHRDGNKANNALANLAWVTPSENTRHAWATGLQPQQRRRRTTCRRGHPLDQVYHQRDRQGVEREWRRCSTCRRHAYHRKRYGEPQAEQLAL